MIAPWVVLEVGADEKSLVVTHGPVSSCTDFVGPAQPLIHETASEIYIRLLQTVRHTGLEDACTRRLVIRLPDPIAGRRIVGEHWATSLPYGSMSNYLNREVTDPPYPDLGMPIVPRIKGLSVIDAVRLLAREGFHAQISGHGREVLSQIPTRMHLAPGSTRTHPYNGVVALRTTT